MKLLLLLMLLTLLLLSSCRTDQPPNVTLCKLRQSADAYCVDTAGVRSYRNFPKLVGSILLTEEDAKSFGKWCYGAKTKVEAHAVESFISGVNEQ